MGVLETLQFACDIVSHTRTKWKTRTAEPNTCLVGDVDADKPKKCKHVVGKQLSEKEETLKVVETCGVEKKFREGYELWQWFGWCGIDWCREQYNTTKVILDVAVGWTLCFVMPTRKNCTYVWELASPH